MKCFRNQFQATIRVIALGAALVPGAANAYDIEKSDCFSHQYFSDHSTSEAFNIADCFYSEALSLPYYDENQYLILQYSHSWFDHAYKMGHPYALEKLVGVSQMLSDFDNQ